MSVDMFWAVLQLGDSSLSSVPVCVGSFTTLEAAKSQANSMALHRPGINFAVMACERVVYGVVATEEVKYAK